jgi:phosphotriesterase-related protein
MADGAKVMTVLGPVDPAEIGPAMMHEHVLIDEYYYQLGNYDAIVDDEGVVTRDLAAYRAAGGSCLVDVTDSNQGRNPAGLARVSRASGVHVVMGGGWYKDAEYPAFINELSTNELATLIEREFRDGVDRTGIRPGIYGELGTDRRFITAREERAFRAVARAQQRIGFSISTHTTHYGELAFEQIALLREEGVPTERIVIGHVGERFGAADVLKIAKEGVFVQIDHVGRPAGSGMISDRQRAVNVAEVVAAGAVDQLTVSMDICTNSQLLAFGGHGFGHLLTTFVPLLREAGVSDDAIDAILVRNPRRVLAFEMPA